MKASSVANSTEAYRFEAAFRKDVDQSTLRNMVTLARNPAGLIVARLLEGDDIGLAAQIASHDHDMTHALCRAVLLRPMEEATLKALEVCAAEFDTECSEACREALQRS